MKHAFEKSVVIVTFLIFALMGTAAVSASKKSEPGNPEKQSQIGVPKSLKATKGTLPGIVRLSWEAVSGAADYLIYRSTSPEGEIIKLGSTKLTYYDDKIAEIGIPYYYWVSATDSSGREGKKSEAVKGLAKNRASHKIPGRGSNTGQ